MATLTTIVAGAVALGAALMAGVFFAFSSFIMGALGRLPAASGIAAMQQINVVVLNRSFLGTFFGTALGSLALVVSAALRPADPGALWLLAGALAYLVGTFGVTIAGNVPWNDRLEAASATDPASEALWSRYRVRWTRLNTARTAAAVLALAMLGVGLVQQAAA